VNADEYEDYLKVVAARKSKLAMVFSAIGLVLLLLIALTLQVGADWLYINALVEQ